MINSQYGLLIFAFLTALFFCSCSGASEQTQNANSQSGKLPVTNNANVTPLSTPTPLQSPTTTPSITPTPTPLPSPKPSPSPANSDSLNIKTGKSTGIVTKINMELGSIELNHDDIPGMMPAMIMEFYVQDKKMLNGLKVGDKVSFVLEDRNGVEKIIELKRQ